MTITEIKNLIYSKVPIVELIGSYIKLKKLGSEHLGLCPFHNEKSPSFSISSAKGIYKCFGCGESGDQITFIMKYEKLGFIDALKFIASKQNLSIDFDHERKEGQNHTNNPIERINFVSKELLVKTLTCYNDNPFFVWLQQIVGKERAIRLVADQYYVGTAKGGGTIFWQVDQFMRIRTGQRIFYKGDGHRDKEIHPKRLFTAAQGYKPCFFGEHQLLTADKDCLIGLVESEKSAIICSAYLPYLNDQRVVWLACSGMNGLSDEKMWVLRGLNVLLVPDMHFLSRMVWGNKKMRKMIDPEDGKLKPNPQGEVDEEYINVAMRLQKLQCKVSFYDPYPERETKEDIADELIKHDIGQMIEPPIVEQLLLPQEGF